MQNFILAFLNCFYHLFFFPIIFLKCLFYEISTYFCSCIFFLFAFLLLVINTSFTVMCSYFSSHLLFLTSVLSLIDSLFSKISLKMPVFMLFFVYINFHILQVLVFICSLSGLLAFIKCLIISSVNMYMY